MMKLLLVLLAASLVALTVYGTSPAERQFKADQRFSRSAYYAACDLTGYICGSGKVPQVRRTNELKKGGARGIYFGGDVIFIFTELRDEQARLSIFHEIVHVLQGRNMSLNFKYMQTCILEREALEYTNAYAKRLKLAYNFQRTLAEWRKLYGCK